LRAVGYFRETRGHSLASQSEEFIRFCTDNGYQAAAAFLDGKSSGDAGGFHQLLEFIKQQVDGGFLIVVVRTAQILGEGPVEAARRYFQLAGFGLPVISIETGDDIGPTLLGDWAEQRAGGSLGDKVRAAMRRRTVKGEALGRPPYGYRVGPKRRLVVVGEEGSVVRYIFRLYLKDSLGIRRIARRLNEEGLRTRRDGPWSMVTVRDILRNRAYVGTYSRFGVRVPASHAPLISQEDFQRVQEQLDQRRPASQSRKISPFLLSGLAYCGYCNNKMIGVTRKQKWKRRSDGQVRTAQYRYYQCESRTNRSLCDYHTRRAEDLEAAVRTALTGGRAKPLISHTRNGANVETYTEEEIRRLRLKARRLDRRLEQCMDAAVVGSIDAEKLRSLGLALATEQTQVEEHLQESHRVALQQANQSARRERHEAVLRRLQSSWDVISFADRQQALREVVAKIVVKDDDIEAVLRP